MIEQGGSDSDRRGQHQLKYARRGRVVDVLGLPAAKVVPDVHSLISPFMPTSKNTDALSTAPGTKRFRLPRAGSA